MAKRLESGEELHLLVSPKSRHLYQGYGPGVFYITYPWSNERRTTAHAQRAALLTAAAAAQPHRCVQHADGAGREHLVVARHPHEDDARVHHARVAIPPLPVPTASSNYPRSARAADAIIINSESLRSEIQHYLKVDDRKLKLIYEAVDHELFKPGDAGAARAKVASHGVTKPFVLFVSSLWPYKNCDGLLRAWALARSELGDRQLAIVGSGRDQEYLASLHSLAAELGISGDVVFVGGVPPRGNRGLLPGGGRLRLPVPQRDLRASHPGGHGLRLPGRDLRHQRHAGNRGRSRGPVRPQGPGVHRPGHRRSGGTAAGSPA